MTPLATLLVQVAIIVALARVMRWLFVPIGQPAVVGEMVAGLLLGPSALGWLMPGVSSVLFAESSLPALNALSQIGLVLFMFVVGLGLGSEKTGIKGRVAIITSVSSIVVPFVMGAWLATTLHARLAPPGVSLVSFALFVGTALSITAFPVLARILIDRELLGTEVGRLAITCAAFDDVAGWLILGAVTAIARAEDLRMALIRTLLFVAYVAVMLLVFRPALKRLPRWRGTSAGASVDDLAMALVIMLVSAVATELLGVHALFGAFFAGLIMPRDVGLEQTVATRIEPLTMALLLPLFFAATGLRTSVQLINGAGVWGDAAVIVGVAIVGKGGASALVARAVGLRWRDAAALGVLLNTRGLIELVVLSIGLDLGILSPIVFSMLVLMALLTTFMTSPIIAWLLPPSCRSSATLGPALR